MRRLLTATFLSLLSLPILGANPTTLPELFRKAKEQVKLGSYEAALVTLQDVDAASQQPGLERDREALKPSLAFYRGVCQAALGRDAEAREQFAVYLEATPQARLDPAMYPKKVIATFEDVQKGSAPPAAEPSASESPRPKASGIAAAYKAFRKPDFDPRAPLGDDWAEGPARFLLTPSEADEFRRLTDPIARSEFIARFWKSRDTKPETPENEFRDEFERRIAFADQYFVQGETRGSNTDRGMVFVLLGPPAYTIQRPMKTGDDTGDPAGVYLYTPAQAQVAAAGGGTRSQQIARVDAVTGPGTSINQPSSNWRILWRYFRRDLPYRIPYEFVDFDFISKPGYGEHVLQREPTTLNVLERAKASLPKP